MWRTTISSIWTRRPTRVCGPSRKVALAVKAAVPCKRVGVAVLGMEVPHTHIHLVPLQTEGDLDFRKQKPVVPEDEMKRIAASILSEYEKL